jgi:hypothetical protein
MEKPKRKIFRVLSSPQGLILSDSALLNLTHSLTHSLTLSLSLSLSLSLFLCHVCAIFRIGYGEQTSIEFEAFNGKNFEVIVEVSPTGEILSRSAQLPFRVPVKPGARVRVGELTCKKDIASQWKWETSPNAVFQPNLEKTINKSEAKGVFLTQIQTPGPRNELEFEVENTLAVNILAEIEIKGTAQIDMQGKTNPLKVLVKARSKVNGGSVFFKGEIALAWGWREDV